MIVLVTGDRDLIPAVEMAQSAGVLVRLVHGPKHTYHSELWTARSVKIPSRPAVLPGTRPGPATGRHPWSAPRR
ncbi:MAG: hypothetical protein DIU84_02180 [Bacillota bacterium]|nr:MAG: hypothetical protein DIU84_02180 [Bacillota bacterium]